MLLTSERTMMRVTAREFARDRLAPFADQWARERTFPADAVAGLGELGFLGMLVPPEWDGTGADHVSYAAALEEIATG
jgi:alkylation response protein AidB-like acyl-CoA dehydrogenase